MINKKWIGLFIGTLTGILFSVFPFIANICGSKSTCDALLTLPWFIPLKIASLLGLAGEAPGVVILLLYFYTFLGAVMGFLIGRWLENKSKKF